MKISSSRVRLRAITADGSSGPPRRSMTRMPTMRLPGVAPVPGQLEMDEIEIAQQRNAVNNSSEIRMTPLRPWNAVNTSSEHDRDARNEPDHEVDQERDRALA